MAEQDTCGCENICEMPANTERNNYDLAVIGAGSAGFSASITAAEAGARVLLVGEGTIGGSCVNVGCVPSKALIRAVESIHQANSAARFAGIEASARLSDWPALIRQKDALVAELRQAKYIDLLPQYPSITYREGHAAFIDGKLCIDDAPVKAGKILIATGSSPLIPAIDGLSESGYLTSTEALSLPELPQSLIVIGGGYIGCELAQLFARAGCAVTITCRRRLLPEADEEISQALEEAFAAEGIRVLRGVAYIRAGRKGGMASLSLKAADDELTIMGEHLLITAGRKANTEGLNLQEAGIKTDAKGAIVVDEHMRTSRSNIYAAGDVTGRDQFVYMAAYGAKVAVQNALGTDSPVYDNRAMPAVVFSDPQVATVGLGERAARARGIDVRTSVLPLSAVPRALAARDTRGLIKLIAENRPETPEQGRILGAQIIAPEGADTIQTVALAIAQNLTIADLAAMICPYLTNAEAIKLAAQTFGKDIAKLSCCAG